MFLVCTYQNYSLMNHDQKEKEDSKKDGPQKRLSNRRIFELHKTKINSLEVNYSRPHKAECADLEAEDEIGPRVYCPTCEKVYYEFQMSDHLKACMKMQLLNARKCERSDNLDKQSSQIPQKNKIQNGYLENSIKNGFKQSMLEIAEEDGSREEIANESFLQLLKFQESRQRISRIAHKSSFVLEEVDESLEQIPCPFCAIKLNLQQLQHIDKCPESVECNHCKDRYPLSLFGPHTVVCKLRPKTNLRADQLSRQSNVIKRQKSPRIFNNNRVRSHGYGLAAGQQSRANNLMRRNNRMPERNQYKQIFNAAELDEQSRLRRRDLKGLSNEQLRSLKSEVYMDDRAQEQNKQCGVCTLEMRGQPVNQLQCGHIFHKECLVPWLRQRSTCPLCKARVVK